MREAPKNWLQMTDSERRLYVLVPMANAVLNLNANEIEARPGGRSIVANIDRLKSELDRFYEGDYRDALGDGESDPYAVARKEFTSKVMAEVAPG